MSFIETLDKRGISYIKTNNPYEILLYCTSGQHADKNPSMSVNVETGLFNCWSCGFRGGKSKLLNSLGIESYIDLDTKQPYKIAKLRKKLETLVGADDIKLPADRKAYVDEYRGIRAETLKLFNAFTTNELGFTDYICVPIYQHKKIRFIEGRLLKTLEKQSKYIRKPAKVKVDDVLFPLDKLRNTNYVILVEGLYDMINMWDLGYHNTLCIFGATNFTKKKVQLLDRLGITRVDIMMDSDIPGQNAANKIQDLLDTANIFSRIIQLAPGIDPGELTKKQAEALLK